MEFCELIAHISYLLKIVANHAMSFSTIDQEQELRLHSCIKIEFQLWCLVCVDPNMMIPRMLFNKRFVVVFNFGTHRVPRCSEVKKSECGSFTVKMFDHIANGIACLSCLWFVIKLA